MTNNQKKTKALESTMRLLVALREMLRLQGATTTPLFKAIHAHANLCALALPNKLRLSKAELDGIVKVAVDTVPDEGQMMTKEAQAKLVGPVKEQPARIITADDLKAVKPLALPKAGEFVALTPAHLRNLNL